MKTPKFKPGDRVRLSDLGTLRSPRVKGRVGTVVSVNSQYAIAVLFDGNKMPTKIHSSYVEAVGPDSHNLTPTD